MPLNRSKLKVAYYCMLFAVRSVSSNVDPYVGLPNAWREREEMPCPFNRGLMGFYLLLYQDKPQVPISVHEGHFSLGLLDNNSDVYSGLP